MIQENSAGAGLACVCPECKNTINLSRYPNLLVGMVIECDHCGMTLLVKGIENAIVNTEIVDEGK
jgi:DNA-directed RNA polymerase subunit RPC12/RpoP